MHRTASPPAPRPVAVRALLALIAPLLLSASGARAQALEGHPFRVLSPTPLASGAHIIEIGGEHRTGVTPQPLLSPATGDLTRFPEVRYRLGFGRAELSVGMAAWQEFNPDASSASDESEVGDPSFWAVVNLLRQSGRRVAVGVALGGKVPSASEESGLGTNEADVFVAVLVGRATRLNEWRFNAGLAILGDPLSDSSQEDLLTWGIAGRHGFRHCLAWEAYGRTASSDDKRDLEDATLEVGYLFNGGRVLADISVLIGLDDTAGDIGASAGIGFKIGEAGR